MSATDAKLQQAREAYQQAMDTTAGQAWDAPLIKYLSTSILVFTTLALIIAAVLLLRQVPSKTVTRIISLPLIIAAAVFLVVVGFDKDQIHPVIALLGTLAGYILGSESRNDVPVRKPAGVGDSVEGLTE